MTQTTDGFIVAEEDMKMRGPGDMEGTQQSGIAFNFKVANITKDTLIMEFARRVASEVLECNPSIMGAANDENGAKEGQMMMSEASLRLLAAELGFRFARSFDWSQIS